MSEQYPGLSQAQASALLLEHGPNQLEAEGRHGFLRRLWEVLSEPTLLVLLVVLGIYVFLGQKGDAGLLSLFVFLVIIITFMEEGRTEEALKALKNFASPRALVRRSGQALRIAGVEVVPGDVLLLRATACQPMPACWTAMTSRWTRACSPARAWACGSRPRARATWAWPSPAAWCSRARPRRW